jgi:hypothetical protein
MDNCMGADGGRWGRDDLPPLEDLESVEFGKKFFKELDSFPLMIAL